ncbi:LysE family translocator [Nocardia sp. NPDC004750]
MPIGTWGAFVASLIVALVVPGPDFVVIVQSTTRGIRRGLAATWGIVTGLCLHAGLTAAGLAALLASLPSLMNVLRLAGAAVLFVLGAAMLRNWRCATIDSGDRAGGPQAFIRGFLTNITNPKAPLFFGAVLPQFLDTHTDMHTRTAILALTVVLGSALWWTSVVILIGHTNVVKSLQVSRVLTLGGGLMLIVIAIALAIGTVYTLAAA